MRFFIALALTFGLYSSINGQSLPYARQVVKTLSSEEFSGRGYLNSGDLRAANFIRDEFISFGLQSYNEDNFFQYFRFPVNTFPEDILLKIGNQTLVPGKDFLVFPGSPSINGNFKSIPIYERDLFDNQTLSEKVDSSRSEIIILDAIDKSTLSELELQRANQVEQFLRRSPNNPAAATLVYTAEKLSWFGATVRDPRPSFLVLKDSVSNPFGEITVDLVSELNPSHQTQNVVGYIEGENTDSTIVLMAHYDHFGKMGQALFPGANDNASGVAMLLSLARHFSSTKAPYNIAFIAFAGEELGLLGAKYFVENPLFDLTDIKFMLNFDIAGTGDDGIQVVNGSVYREQFDQLVRLNDDGKYMEEVKIRGTACISDHCLFDQREIPGFYIYTLGGIRAYHDIYDKYETLPFTDFEDYYELMIQFINNLD